MDLNGKADPYVKVNLRNAKYKTSVVKENLNPSWNNTFHM